MKTFPLHHESFHDAVGKFSRSIVTVCGKKREGMGGRVQAREGRAHARLYEFSVFCCHVVTFSYKMLVMNGLCVTISVTIVTNGDNGFGVYCHT